MGHEPRLVRQHHRPLPGTHPAEARRHAVRRRRPPPQHRALQHRRRQRPGRPQGLHEDRRDDGRLLEGPRGHHPGGHRLVEPGRPRALGLVRRPGPALVGGPGEEEGDPLGGVQQLTALVPDRQRLRLGRLRREHRPDPGGPRRRLRHLPGQGDRAAGEEAPHQVRHHRPAQRTQHQLLGHPARPRRTAHGRPPGRRARRTGTPAEGRPGPAPRPRHGEDPRHRLRDGRDQPQHLRPQLERLRRLRPRRRRPAQRAHLRHRHAHQCPGQRQGRRPSLLDERGRGHLGHRHRLHRHGTRARHRHPDRRRHT